MLVIKTLFYFNNNYPKSPYIKNPKRKFVEVVYDWEKTFLFRRNQMMYKDMDVEEFIERKGEARYQENLFRWQRDEVVDYPFLWQPDLIDEWDDFRYRNSAYLKRPVLRINMHYRWSEANFTENYKIAIVTKRLILMPIGIPLLIMWCYTNIWLLYDFYFEAIFLNDYVLNKIGLEVPTLYSILIRLYYTNTINQIVSHLIERTDEVTSYVWVMDEERDDEKESEGNILWSAHGYLDNFRFSGFYYSTEKSKIRKAIHNYNLVTSILIDYFYAYDTHNKLDTFLIKEILLALKYEQEKRQVIFDKEMREKTSYFVRFLDFVLRPYRRFHSYFYSDSRGVTQGLAYSYKSFTQGNYFIVNDLAKWAFFDADVYFEDTVWCHYNWWRYYNAFPRASIPGYDAPNMIEYIRNIEIKRYYLKDFFKFCIVEVYNKLFKPKDDSFFWTLLNAFNLKRRNHILHASIYITIIEPAVRFWLNIIDSLKQTRDNVKYSIIGFIFFLDRFKPGKYDVLPRYRNGLWYPMPCSDYIPAKSRLFNTLKYRLVFTHGFWDFPRYDLYVDRYEKANGWYSTSKEAFPTCMASDHIAIDRLFQEEYRRNNFTLFEKIVYGTKYRFWSRSFLMANVFCSPTFFYPNVEYKHDYSKPLLGMEDFSENKSFEEMYPDGFKTLFDCGGLRYPLKKELEMLENANKSKSTLDIFWVNYDLSLNIFANLTFLNLLINFLSIIFLFKLFTYNIKSLKIFDDFVIKNIYFFFWNLFKNLVLNIRLERFFFVIISYFFCIIFFNLGGFSFYELSFMSHVSVTFFFSFSIFVNYIINIFINFNESIYLKFVQKANVLLVPFLFVIEIISFLVRPFSLGIRLFANVMSGHILMHMFFSTFIFCYKISFWVSLIIFSFCMFIFFMELFVSFIQAYIFMILLLVYLVDLANIH